MKKIFGSIIVLFCLFLNTSFAYASNHDFLYDSLNIDVQLININHEVGVKIVPEYIVIHETGGYRAGVDSDRIYSYWNRDENAEASTHFIVDENHTIQLLELDWKGWHVGDNQGHSDITNNNSIGIEICVNEDGDYLMARARTIRLTRYLMKELDIDIDHVVRHYDASGKHCPDIMLRFPFLWDDFKYQLMKPDEILDGIYLNMERTASSVENKQYLSSNSLIESKLTFKKYNVSSFAYSLVKTYVEAVPYSNLNSIMAPEKRVLTNISSSEYYTGMGVVAAKDVYKLFSDTFVLSSDGPIINYEVF